MTPFLETGRGSLPEQDRDQAIESQASSQHSMEAPSSPALKDANPGEPVNLEDAFLAITEELNFDFPEPSPVDRIKGWCLLTGTPWARREVLVHLPSRKIRLHRDNNPSQTRLQPLYAA
jgi:hypothetical protein